MNHNGTMMIRLTAVLLAALGALAISAQDTCTLKVPSGQAFSEFRGYASLTMQDPNWAELMKSMQTMHTAMGAAKASGNDDVDFVNLMLPHHEAAVDMAKAELLHGSDSQMRRLAQEIIADQESEIQLMHLWLSRQRTPSREPQTPDPQKEQ